jgi:hypothetical protein
MKLHIICLKKNMALTPSKMFPLYTVAPEFNLLDVNLHQESSLQELRGKKGTLIFHFLTYTTQLKK